jgi:hypothetical protein
MILEWTEQAKECLALQYNCYYCSLGKLGVKNCKTHKAVKWMVLNGNLPYTPEQLRLSKLLKDVITDIRKLPLDVVAEKHKINKSNLLRAITAWANGQHLSRREAVNKLKLPVSAFRADWLGR